MLTAVQRPLDEFYDRTVPDVGLLGGSAALAAPKQSRQQCSGSSTPAFVAHRTGTYITIAHCRACGHWVRVKADGNLRAHQGRSLSRAIARP